MPKCRATLKYDSGRVPVCIWGLTLGKHMPSFFCGFAGESFMETPGNPSAGSHPEPTATTVCPQPVEEAWMDMRVKFWKA